MAKYADAQGNITEVGNAELNPGLVAGKTLVPDTTPIGSGPINSAILTPTPDFQYHSVVPTPMPNIAGLDSAIATPPMTATPQETQASDLTKRLQALNDSLVGKSQFQAQQEQAQGIPELITAQNDLAKRLKSLQNEALAIPLQIQNDFTGRASLSAMSGKTQAALRNNAIQALSTSSLLEASRGNLATAQTLADRAVAQKYGPVEEQIKASQANLDLILKDPTTTLAEKNRANAQKEIQDARQTAINIAKENDKTIQGLVIQAGLNGAPSVITMQAQQAKTPMEAIQILGNYAQKETVQSIQEYQFAVRNGYKGSYIKYQNEDANRKIAIAKASQPTQIQTNNALYASRMQQGASTIDQKQVFLSKLNPISYQAQLYAAQNLGAVGNSSISPELQQVFQAERNFLNAVLRRESGAVISPTEFDEGAKQYFPTPGDSQTVLNQKKENRDLAIQVLKQGSGTAYPQGNGGVNDPLGVR